MSSQEQRSTQNVTSAGAEPRVSVIIPVYNDMRRLRLCLDALERQTFPSQCYEVIVVDNGSDEPIDEVVADFRQARLLHESTPGSYSARNTGIRAARGEILAFTDADCIPATDWLEHGVAALGRIDHGGLVGGKLQPILKNPAAPTATELYECTLGFQQETYVRDHKHAVTANMFTSRAIFNDIGLFNSELKSGGDAEWGKRVHAAGCQVVFGNDVVVAHPTRQAWSEVYAQTKRIAGGIHDRRKTQFKAPSIFMLLLTLPTTAIRIWFHQDLTSFTDKVKVISVMAGVRLVLIWEQLRLQVGLGSPSR